MKLFIDPKLLYKRETGLDPYFSFQAKHLTHSLDSRPMLGMNAKEILSMIDYDTSKNAKWGIFIEDLPEQYQDNEGDLTMYSPEYVQWLEDNLNINEIK